MSLQLNDNEQTTQCTDLILIIVIKYKLIFIQINRVHDSREFYRYNYSVHVYF